MTADLTNTQDLLHFLSEIVITLVITKTSGFSLLADQNLHDDRTSPGGPVVKTSPSNAGGVGSIPGWGAKIPYASLAKKTKLETEAIL